jgi:hypothetical protein
MHSSFIVYYCLQSRVHRLICSSSQQDNDVNGGSSCHYPQGVVPAEPLDMLWPPGPSHRDGHVLLCTLWFSSGLSCVLSIWLFRKEHIDGNLNCSLARQNGSRWLGPALVSDLQLTLLRDEGRRCFGGHAVDENDFRAVR